jgi:putative membrane protein
MMKMLCAALAVSLSLGLVPAHARSDEGFVRAATQANLAEINVGRLAAQRAQMDSARRYGSMLVRHHRDANQKLGRLARRYDLDVPLRPNAEQRAAYRRLSMMRGRTFDRTFLRQMVKDHEAAVALFRSQARDHRAITRRFARETLPTLEQHLVQARSLLDQTSSGRYDVRGMDRHDDGMDRDDGDRSDHMDRRHHDDRDQSDDSDGNRDDGDNDMNEDDSR